MNGGKLEKRASWSPLGAADRVGLNIRKGARPGWLTACMKYVDKQVMISAFSSGVN